MVLVALSSTTALEGCGGPDAGVLAPDSAVPPTPAPQLRADGGPAASRAWARVPTGSYVMGSPPSEACREPNGIPETSHLVTLTHGFEISVTEVTQDEFEGVLGYNPSQFKSSGVARPVESVSWHEAAAYCSELSARSGLPRCYICTGSGAAVSCSPAPQYSSHEIYRCAGYRLPTEAEWEYSYRAGTATAFPNGASDQALCDGHDPRAEQIAWGSSNSGGATHAVGQRLPNAWGIHDMAGNVWEWTHDGHQGDLGSAAVSDPVGDPASVYRVFRGGSWFNDAKNLRAANRFFFEPSFRANVLGLRCVRTL